MPLNINIPTDLSAKCAALLSTACIDAEIYSLVSFNGGSNNRTYRLDTSAGAFVVKQYFRHESDTRDRLLAEFEFLEYASKAAPSMAPAPFAMDNSRGMALYEFIEGQPYKAGEITWVQVRKAADFFNALNNPSARKYVPTLPVASEACFSITDHLNLIAARLDRLRAIELSSDEDLAAQALIEQIHYCWLTLSKQVISFLTPSGRNPDAPLDPDQRCLSPSDFGFHNALARSDGDPCFLDFEYAGWDDPAKMTGDFFAQLAVPVPGNLFEAFVRETTATFPRSHELVERACLLRPLYQVKWCCIALNVFLPVNLARRKFANPSLDEYALKKMQLKKAETLFHSIIPSNYGLH